MQAPLTERVEILVRFNEADPLGIVWHGHYVRYMEDGREAFGNRYGLRYLDIYEKGYTVPVVHVDCNYKRSLRYGDSVIVETRYIPTPAAKVRFEYTLFNARTLEVVATGSSVQVFLDKETQTLQLIPPAFFEAWKKEHALI
ncbi:4-hydroxybenzoyl-CoA thioesterase [Chitinophaga parva]|uniref:4-hydroxybenzoyl-CoA thioesterase n=1 Tax=Chitinophaga parva TaxID=2169414 RepID=A0A2T7BFR6_9BACT|nr:acyl-CoA thioesterase [Chitinophaga parva]PUZ25127.1 4-hydroxybenzoyl-CoA thioesterase [Chitinophaga parva]